MYFLQYYEMSYGLNIEMHKQVSMLVFPTKHIIYHKLSIIADGNREATQHHHSKHNAVFITGGWYFRMNRLYRHRPIGPKFREMRADPRFHGGVRPSLNIY